MDKHASLDTETSGKERYQPGDVIATRYRLLRKVGEGAMAAVWAALNEGLKMRVAVKLLHPEHHGLLLAMRLQREAELTAKVSHPAVVRVFDYGHTILDDPYLVMELLRGETLRDVLGREDRLPPERAVQVLLPIVGGMDAAHAHGILHRDLKPENVFLSRDDAGRMQPKVIDFGIARMYWPEEHTDITGRCLLGTPDYMAPEQALGHEGLDQRVDVWAFCVMLYRVLAGEPPFRTGGLAVTLASIVNEPAPSLIEKGIDAGLWYVVDRGLRKDPTERWATMKEVGGALARWLASRGLREDVTGASLWREWLPPEDWARPGAPQAVAVHRALMAPTVAFPLVRHVPTPMVPADTGAT
jgi:serine/threonine-protein kinase